MKITPKMKASDEEGIIGVLYAAMIKHSWEKGPTDDEAICAANDWFYNKYGYERGAASVRIPKMMKPRRRGKPTAGDSARRGR